MAELTWECLIISMVLLFGINIGLAIGLTELHKKKAAAISISYGLVLLILSMLANFLNGSLYSVINYCIPAILGIIGIVILLSGIYTIKKWKSTEEEYDSIKSAAMLSSSICYFAGFTSAAVLLSREITSSFTQFNLIMAVSVILAIMGFYLFSKILRHAEMPYHALLGNFMILNGFYFLISAAFIPNLANLASLQTSPLTINSDLSSLIFMIMAFTGVFLLGSYLKGENITSLKDIYGKLNLSAFNRTKKTKQSK